MALLSNPAVVYGGALALAWKLYGYIRERQANPNRLPLPPGPKGLPIIGNMFDAPNHKSWLVYNEWFKTYGDMVYFNVLGQSFLVLGSVARTYDLFERRSANYADRPHMVMLLELMDWNFNFALLPYGDWWRRHRRSFHDHFHPNIVYKYQPTQLSAARAFLRHVLHSPEDFMYHSRHVFAATIMKVTYGITVKERDDPYILNAEESMEGLSQGGNPGAFLVELFPIMKYIPSWFPGAGWKRKAEHWRKVNKVVSEKPYDYVKEQMRAGVAEPCIATALIERLPDEDAPNFAEQETLAKDTCAIAFAGGADTTVSALQSFFMAMCIYPEVLKKAQAELDSVLGGRLPEFNDRPNLPYMNAVVKEALRWQLVVPNSLVHMCTHGDEYDGYYIPKGTIVLGNSWAILHDPEYYDDVHTFKPERYLKDGKLNPEVRDPVEAFGYGRRICPGRFFADESLFALVANVCTVFDIRPGLDENGKELKIEPLVTSGMISHPEPFECRITPRSSKAEELIRNSELLD